jgi:hypothetical protein
MTTGRRLGALALAGVLLAVGCAARVDPPPPARLGRPEWKVGDRWLFRRTPATGAPTFTTHEVIEATPEGYAVRMTRLGQDIIRYWTPELHLARQTAGGQPLNRFDPAARYFDWPLRPGKVWTQEFDYEDGRADGHYTNEWRVARQGERLDLVSGFFLALKIERLGADGKPLDTYWYVPEVRYWARFTDHLNRYTEELAEFQPAPS